MQNAHPVASIDYPETYQEFLDWFDSEESCRLYLRKCRWPDGFICSRCASVKEPWITSRGYLHCRECQHEVSVTAGTIFHRTRMPLRTWFAVAWFVTSQKDGASALGLQRSLGIQSYQTAWTCLHKLRSAMVRPGRDQLSGRIEVDESYFGGCDEGGKRGRGSENKAIVAIAVELHSPKGFGRVRMQRIPDVTKESLIPFVCGIAKTGSEIRTDGWASYNTLSSHGYSHHRTVISESGDPAHVSMPAVHRVAALVKRWLLSTHQGAASGKHLDYYLDEYTFRFNRRSSQFRGLLFYRLIQQAAAAAPTTYEEIVSRNHHILG
jgi:transposase-like protein